ncbi:hypothetical protein E2C01_059772 [Portunus trituberculatus]|uniref:Uncharacterized protein n=1 Tax=Portunus trituberculatus TaxID=210409 RepID=A0A5B7HA76_PORTR|nr:hypothetical protein [Portunus trituberculatus]
MCTPLLTRHTYGVQSLPTHVWCVNFANTQSKHGESLQTPSLSPSDATALQLVMEENKFERGSPPRLDPTDIIAEDMDLEPMVEESLESIDFRVEGLPHAVMQP